MTKMNRRSMSVVLVAATALLCTATAGWAQDKPAPPQRVQAKVDVVVARYQGEKKVASQPYMMMPTIGGGGNGYANLRIGVDVPIGTTTTTRPPNPNGTTPGVTTTEPKYQNVGTNMDCQINPLPDGRYEVMVSVTDSSLFSPDGSAASARPSEASAFRTFQGRNTLLMRDGQTMLLTTATDKVTGEVIKVEVTLTLMK